MNNIYKVIWSKAKNCYVVASEIARSHTKSASGSEKIGGVTRRSLLASLMALSLLCGGLGVASAADDVSVAESTAPGAVEVYTKTGVNTLLDGKANTSLDNLSDAGKAVIKTTMTDELAKKADATALDGKANTSLDNLSEAGKSVIKTTMAGELANKADATAVTALEGRVGGVEGKVTALETTVGDASSGLVKDVNDLNTAIGTKANQSDLVAATNRISTNEGNISALQKKTTNISYADGAGTSIDGITVKDGNIVGNGNSAITGITNIATDNINGKSLAGTTVATLKEVTDEVGTEKTERENADKALSDRIGNLTEDKNYIKKDKNVSDNLVELDKQAKTNADAITETNQRTHGITRDDTRNETRIEGRVTVDTNGNINAEGTITSNGLNAGSGEITTSGKVSAGDVSTGTLETTGDATIGGNLDVKGTLNTKDVTAETIHVSKSEDTVDYKSEGSIIGEGGNLSVSNKKTDKSTNITEESQLHVNEKGTVNWATSTENATGNVTEGRSEVTADHIKNSVKKTEGGTTFGYEENITETGKVGTATDKDGNRNELTQTATSTENTVTSKDGNKSTTKQEAGSISSTVYDKDGNVKASSEMKEDGSISNNATGDMTNTVGGKLTTTVTGQATENFNGGLNTKVTGAENHTVTGKQTNTVEGGQENIISGGQTNTITGGQINNITGDQTTTITGNKKETVTENVTEDYKKDLTTTVGGNETHEVKGTKTETVEGKVTENYNGGQETNVTGDQVIKVSGTQTTTATDINRNASSGMIDTIDNDYGTNTETKVAGKTTTDVSIKGTGEEGKYIRGANESRDYLIKGTLMNSETKTAEATTTEITDGNGKTSATIQDVNNLAGSVTNGTETGVSGIHANDNSVSIDSIVTDGNKSYSVINQKKGSIQSTVVDGTSSTVILQDKDNVTIASSKGMVGIVGKDIVNNAQDTITNTAGTKITDTAGDSTVTTENGKGTRFTKTGSTAYREGGPTDTNISGNTITTGKVTMDYADVMKDLGVRGNANITGKTTTGSLEVKGESKLTGDVTMENNATVGKNLTVNGITTTNTLKVTENATVGGTLEVTKKATFSDDVDIAKNLSVGGNATIAGDVTAKSYKVGDKTYISAAGINANDQKITNVADGSISEGSKDAVNGGQLYGVKRDLEHKVDKVGANAAAMANLRPMEFDPSSKWNIAAAIGNYGSETAAAIGAFYRPNDDVMVNLSTAFGTGENMVGGGVSVRLGKSSNKLSREENNALKDQVNDLTARMDALLSVLNPNLSKDFPDVPENHWAYEAVSRLAGNDIVQGYPDGEFHGERTMTRYEMAEIIYNALSRGAEAEKELVEEFKPELQAMAASEKATAEKAEG